MNEKENRIYLTDIDIRTLKVVNEIGEKWEGNWISAYDVQRKMPRFEVRLVSFSFLKPMATAGLLETQKRTGCPTMYRLTEKGKAIINIINDNWAGTDFLGGMVIDTERVNEKIER